MKIRWTNLLSGETGFVKNVNSKERYFEATKEENEAKVYKTHAAAKSVITKLESFGEGEAKNNSLEVVA